MNETAAESYDAIPYGDYAFAATHPDRLAAVARLHGLDPPDVRRCRVLEIGSAIGGNLLPMALSLPEAAFLGIDVSPRQVAVAQRRASEFGLANVEFRTQDVLDFPPDAGTFDYVVCHGVYSWVPPAVQDRILAVCRAHLAPDGIAYLSFNCLPGWRIRGLIREMIQTHVRRFDDPLERLAQARAFLGFASQTFAQWDTLYAGMVRHEVDELLECDDDYLYHEHLETFNEPLYFTEFARRIAAHGLEYVAEAENPPGDHRLGPQLSQQLWEMSPDRRQFEELRDFVVARMFRKSLLCRSDRKPAEFPRKERLRSLRFVGLLHPLVDDVPVADAEAFAGLVRSDAAVEFRTAEGESLKTNHPPLKSALGALVGAYPRSLAFDELRAATLAGLPPGTNAAEVDGLLVELLMRSHAARMVEIRTFEPPFATSVPERPRASPVARSQAVAGAKKVVNLRHRSCEPTEFDRVLLPLLDGTRDRNALRDALVELARSGADDGAFAIEGEDGRVTDPELLRVAVSKELESSLRRLAGEALLVSD